MNKLPLALLILALSTCLVSGNHLRQKPLRRQFSARQQQEPAPTGYPPAGETPEVPFELPSKPEEPETVYGPPKSEEQPQPDVVYGPPKSGEQEPDSVYGPPESADEETEVVYGPPETDSNDDQTKLLHSDEELEAALDLDDVDEEVLVDEDGSIVEISATYDQDNVEEVPARLVYQRFPQRRHPPTAVPERLTRAKTNVAYKFRHQ